MVQFQTTSIPNIVSYVIDGDLNGTQLESVLAKITETTRRYDDVRLLGVIKSVDGVSDIKKFFGMITDSLNLIGKVKKYAVVADSALVKGTAFLDNLLIPGLDVKQFDADEKEEALEWLREPTVENTLEVKLVDLGTDQVLGLNIDGKLSKADTEFIHNAFEHQLKIAERIRLYVEIEDLDGITLKGLWGDIKLEVGYANKLEKVAFVTDYPMKAVVQLADFILPKTEAKYFANDAKEEAKVWIK